MIELLEATHFLRNGPDGSGESDGNPEEVRIDQYYALDAAQQILASSLLGLTIQCAKCHDHKFEPITQREYYQLQAYLFPIFNLQKWLKPNERFVHASLPGEVEAWEARQRARPSARSGARRAACCHAGGDDSRPTTTPAHARVPRGPSYRITMTSPFWISLASSACSMDSSESYTFAGPENRSPSLPVIFATAPSGARLPFRIWMWPFA